MEESKNNLKLHLYHGIKNKIICFHVEKYLITRSVKRIFLCLSAFTKLSRTITLSQMLRGLMIVITRSVTEIFVVFAGFPAAAYAAYAAGRGYSGYPSFGLPYPTGNHLSLNHLNHHNAAHIAPLNLNLNLIQAQPAPHHNPPTPTPLFYHPNLDLYNAMPLWTNSLINDIDNELRAHSNPSLYANWLAVAWSIRSHRGERACCDAKINKVRDSPYVPESNSVWKQRHACNTWGSLAEDPPQRHTLNFREGQSDSPFRDHEFSNWTMRQRDADAWNASRFRRTREK